MTHIMAENAQPDIYYCTVCHARAPSEGALVHTSYLNARADRTKLCDGSVDPLRIKSGTYIARPDGRFTCETCGSSGGTLRILSCLPSCTSYGAALDGASLSSLLAPRPGGYGEMEYHVMEPHGPAMSRMSGRLYEDVPGAVMLRTTEMIYENSPRR